MDVKLPRLGEGAESGTVVGILISEGDAIDKEQPIMELETEKAVGTIPSSETGVVEKIYVKMGDKISAGQPILSIRGSETPSAQSQSSQPDSKLNQYQPAGSSAPTPSSGGYQYESKSGVSPPASPSIRKLAKEVGIDLSRVKGSEHGGRIMLQDVRNYIQWLQTAAFQKQSSESSNSVAKTPIEKIDFSKWGEVTVKPVSSLRGAIGRRMTASWTSIPHVTQFDEADITDLLALKKKYDAKYLKKKVKLTVTSFALKAVVSAMQKYPIVNSSLDEVGNQIVYKNYFHIGVAVDTEQGLIVPVIRDVDKKTMMQLSKELDEVATRTRERKVTADELKGGSFTISNLGGLGVGQFTPIVNKPEVGILGLGRGVLRPVVREKQVVQRVILPVALSYDHRVIDGADGARFIREVVTSLESFAESELKI